jgi:hypothetical protein
MSVVLFKFRFNILISGKIIKEMPGSVASGTLCILVQFMKGSSHQPNYTSFEDTGVGVS